MNIDQIKRNIAASKRNPASQINYNEPSSVPLLRNSGGSQEEIVFDKRSKDTSKRNVANDIFGKESDDEKEDECKPNSKIWESEEFEDIDLPISSGSISKFISSLGLNDEKYCWDLKKKKGGKSRMNFTNYLMEKT